MYTKEMTQHNSNFKLFKHADNVVSEGLFHKNDEVSGDSAEVSKLELWCESSSELINAGKTEEQI